MIRLAYLPIRNHEDPFFYSCVAILLFFFYAIRSRTQSAFEGSGPGPDFLSAAPNAAVFAAERVPYPPRNWKTSYNYRGLASTLGAPAAAGTSATLGGIRIAREITVGTGARCGTLTPRGPLVTGGGADFAVGV